MATRKKGTWDINIEINGDKVKNNLNGVGQSIGKLRGQLRKLSPGTDEFIKKSAELKKARAQYKKINDEINQTNISLEEAQGHWANLFGGAVSGDIKMLQSGLKGVVGNLKGMTKAALSFVATPFGAVLTALVGIAGVTKLWADYNIELYKTTKLTQQLTGLNGEMLSNLRDDVSGVAETFDKDFNDVLKASNSLAKQMGISHKEAIDLISQGFARGADINGDFLDKVKEYPVQFKNAGYTAQEFIDVATQEVKGGVYSDKLLDTLKEANLSLTEMTKTQKDALENAFGKKFTEELAKGIASGETTTKQAIERIITEADNLGLNLQQKQQIISDVFKGAGEDAGGFDEIVKQLNASFDENNKKLTENETATLRLSEATIESKKAMADLFDASQSGFPAMLTNIQAIGKEIFTNFLRGIKFSTTSLKQMISVAKETGATSAAQDIVEDMKRFDSSKEEAIKYKLETTQKNIDRVKAQITDLNFVEGLIGTDDTLQAKLSEFIAYKDELLKIASDTSTKFNQINESYINPDDPVNENTPNKPNKKTKSNVDAAINELTPEDKKKIASKKKLAELLDQWEAEQKLKAEIKDFEEDLQKQFLEEEKINQRFAKLEEQAHGETDLLKRLEEQKEAKIQEVRDKWAKVTADKQEQARKNKEAADKVAAQRERVLLEQRTAQYANMFGSIANLLGKNTKAGKAAAIAQATINTYKGVSEVWSSKSILPEPLATISRIASTATVLASGLGAVSQIKSTSLPGMYDGGFTPNQSFGNDRYGPITSFNHGNEYVVPEIVRADPTYATQINTLEKARTQKLDLPPTEESGASSDSTTKMLSEAVYMLIDKLDQPIIAQALIGDDEIERQKTRQEKLTNNRENAKIKS